jgi:hypothetical protein
MHLLFLANFHVFPSRFFFQLVEPRIDPDHMQMLTQKSLAGLTNSSGRVLTVAALPTAAPASSSPCPLCSCKPLLPLPDLTLGPSPEMWQLGKIKWGSGYQKESNARWQ